MFVRAFTFAVLLLALIGAGQGSVAHAQAYTATLPNGTPAQEVPGIDQIDVEEQLDQQLPLDLPFTDHTGRSVTLRDYFDGERPVMLTFAYHSCPSLCSLVLDATEQGASAVQWTAGQEYQMVTISIDPRDTPERAAEKRAEMMEKYGRDNAEWAFLVGEDEAIEAITDAAGYRYFYNAAQEQYAHPAAVMFTTPDGKMARYLYGLRLEANDVRFALLEASEGRSVSTTERILLYCYAYDPNANGYALVAVNVMKLGGGLTVLLLGGFLFFMWRRERRTGGANRTSNTDSSARSSAPKQAEA